VRGGRSDGAKRRFLGAAGKTSAAARYGQAGAQLTKRRVPVLITAAVSAGSVAAAAPPRAAIEIFEPVQARAIEAVDGDSLRVVLLREPFTIHIVEVRGIDAPEISSGPPECGAIGSRHHLVQEAFAKPRDLEDDGLVYDGNWSGRRVELQVLRRRGRALAAYVHIRPAEGPTFDVAAALLHVGSVRARRDTKHGRARYYRQLERRTASTRLGVVQQNCGGHFHRPSVPDP
jgi:endonuclease YncB( thermonuclease family)